MDGTPHLLRLVHISKNFVQEVAELSRMVFERFGVERFFGGVGGA